MIQHAVRLVVSVAMATCFFGAASAQTNHCQMTLDARTRAMLDPATDGPARLEEIFCNTSTPHTFQRLEVSPDGRLLAHADGLLQTDARVMRPGAQDADSWSDELARSGFPIRGAPLQWDSSAPVLWAGLQETVERGGWAAAPLRLARVAADEIQGLPPLDPAEGRLDAVHWIRNGLVLAQLDTRGQYYRPELPNPNPSFAIVDARSGKLRARLDYRALEAVGQAPARMRIEAGVAAAAVLPNGKVRAVLNAGDWIVWTEDEQPRVIVDPYPGSRDQLQRMFAMAPDGGAFVVSALLHASGMICEHNPRCPRPTPAEGVWAALHDATTGEAIWQIRGAATEMGNDYVAPEISPDGRHVLIPLPPNGAEPNLALVSMADGSLLQQFNAAQNFGFIRDGTALWIERGGLFAIYSLSGPQAAIAAE